LPKQNKNITKLIPVEIIINKMYIIRGVKVMLDKDLAAIYEVETKRFNEADKKNIERFPDDLKFQLTREENNSLRLKFETLYEKGCGKYSKFLPNAFTQQGGAMLCVIINSSKAIAMNIAIMRAFVEMRKVVLNNKSIAKKLKQIKYKLRTKFSISTNL
jgi:phage regulator Rha-like protein